MQKVDLSKKPYYLSESDIQWVEDTIQSMTTEEKIGQLFINLFHGMNSDNAKSMIDKFHLGGARYLSKDSKTVHRYLNDLQKNSKIPLLIAANTDSGADGAISDGTYISTAAMAEASGNITNAHDAGYVAGREATAIGCNWTFNPIVDILGEWRNTIVNNRAFGKDPEVVLKHARAYVKGVQKSNMLVCAKHFPGDGVIERDQHLVLGVNELSCDEWDKSFGKVYKELIDDGIETVMVGHIALPEYSYKLNPDLTYQDILPASLSVELLDTLLKEKLGFNGLVVTDASHMVGIAAAMEREKAVPTTIASGCDMFLFFNDPEEDFEFMLNGYKNGIITEERLLDALRRILGLKAKLKLHEKQANGTLITDPSILDVVGCEEHLEMAKVAVDRGISLIKDTWNQLPITPITHKRVRLHTLFGETNGLLSTNNDAEKIIVEELEKAGFEVTLNDGSTRIKGKISDLKENYDVALIFADVVGYAAENNYRIRWRCAQSTDVPWFIYEIPTVFVSLNFTTHLSDVPMVKTYINAYKDTQETIHQVIQKIMGESEFKGQSFNDNVWCESWETKR